MVSIEANNENQALAPGCDLWIIAPPAQSKWARRIDWYLNYQVMKAELHRPAEIGSEMRSLLAEAEFDFDATTTSSSVSNLMIASSRLLPNRTTVVVPFEADVKTWATSCHALWKSLGRPSVRVFLPDSAPSSGFINAWPSVDREAVALEVVSG